MLPSESVPISVCALTFILCKNGYSELKTFIIALSENIFVRQGSS